MVEKIDPLEPPPSPTSQQQVLQLAKDDPKAAAELIKQILRGAGKRGNSDG